MKKFFVFTVIAFVIGLFGFKAEAAQMKVAVFVEGNLDKEQKNLVNAAIMERLSKSKDFRAFERNSAFLKAVEREHDYEISGQVSESEVRTIGEKLGVDYVIAVCATVTKDNQCHMSARLIDIETGEILKTCNDMREIEGSETFTAIGNNVAYRLTSKKLK